MHGRADHPASLRGMSDNQRRKDHPRRTYETEHHALHRLSPSSSELAGICAPEAFAGWVDPAGLAAGAVGFALGGGPAGDDAAEGAAGMAAGWLERRGWVREAGATGSAVADAGS